MKTYSYQLPPEKIAQRPIEPAHLAKMLVIQRGTQEITEDIFFNLDRYLKPSDVLVLNNTKVLPARLLGAVSDRQVEIFLLEEIANGTWRAIGRPMKLLRQNATACFQNGISAELEQHGERELLAHFKDQHGKPAGRKEIFSQGLMPIPPYIRNGLSDQQDLSDYQTYFAKVEGSIAAPTASLHFTESLVSKLQGLGIQQEFVTLHVGLSSILGLGTEPPGSERLVYDAALMERLSNFKQQGRRIVAVGTTVVRALESFARATTEIADTDLFITPGFEFKVVDGLITNFHMPETTHLLLVEAFMKSRELLDKVYTQALNKDFRFLSYGDGMLIL